MKLNKFIYTLTGAALMLGAWACTDKIEYDPAPAFNGDDVFFPDGAFASYEIPTPSDEQPAEITIGISRIKADDALTVNLSSTVLDGEGNSAADIFSVPTTVSFAAGEKAATIVVPFDFDKVVAEVKYLLDLKIEGNMTSPYGAEEIQATLIYAPWGEWKRLGEDGEYAQYTFSNFGMESEAAIYYSESLVPGSKKVKYQIGDYDCPELNEDEADWSWFVNGYNATLIVDYGRLYTFKDGSQGYPVQWLPMATGDDTSFGAMIYVADVFTFTNEINRNPYGSYPDETLQIQSTLDPNTGLMNIMTIWYCNGAILSGNLGTTREFIQLPGFTQPELVFSLGNHIINDKTRQEITQIDVYHNDLVASYVYDVFDKTLTADEIAAAQQAMRDNDSQVVYTDASASYDYYFRTPGTYSIVYLAFDAKGEEIASLNDPTQGGGYWQFNYEPAIPFTWKSLGKAKYTDGFIYSIYDEPAYTWEVEVEQSTVNPGLYRLVNPYRSGNGWKLAKKDYDLDGNYYININMTDASAIYVEQSSLGIQMDAEDGEIFVYSALDQALNDPENPFAPATLKRRYAGVLTNNVLEFHGKALLIGWSNVLNSNGGFEWEYTNLWAEKPDAADATQWKQYGEFALDMSTLSSNAAAAPAKKVAGKPAKKSAKAVKKGSRAKFNGNLLPGNAVHVASKNLK